MKPVFKVVYRTEEDRTDVCAALLESLDEARAFAVAIRYLAPLIEWAPPGEAASNAERLGQAQGIAHRAAGRR